MASSYSSDDHDLFISFRGKDVRRGFLSHLTKEFDRKGVVVFVDDKLEKGQEILPALLRKIEGSPISLVIFSKSYASSPWCLEELLKIMDCKEVNGQIVIPVFYKVEPSDVRTQNGRYKHALVKLEHELKDNIDKLQVFRSALYKAANLSGYHSSKFENDAELVQKIVNDLSEKLDDIYPGESPGHIGIDQQLARIVSFLKRKAKAVQIAAIWGMGGIYLTKFLIDMNIIAP